MATDETDKAAKQGACFQSVLIGVYPWRNGGASFFINLP
jgi:hypothetical protein